MKKLTPILINKAIDLYANEPNITHSAVAERLGITNKTLMKLRKYVYVKVLTLSLVTVLLSMLT